MEKSIVNVNATGITREYDAQYKIKVLKANIPFAEQVTDEDTKYVIRWNFDLDGEEVEIPANCILEFDGGNVSNGTIIGNNTCINAGLTKIFGIGTTLEGSWNINEIESVWFEQFDRTILTMLCCLTYLYRPTINCIGNIVTDTPVIITSPVILNCNDLSIHQTVWGYPGVVIDSSDVSILGTLRIYADVEVRNPVTNAYWDIEDKKASSSGIILGTLAYDNGYDNLVIDNVYIYNFIAGICNHGGLGYSNIHIKYVYVENVDFGIFGAGYKNVVIDTVQFKDIASYVGSVDPSHAIYFTGGTSRGLSKNVVINNLFGEGCSNKASDTVIGLKSIEGFTLLNANVRNIEGFSYVITSDAVFESCRVYNAKNQMANIQLPNTKAVYRNCYATFDNLNFYIADATNGGELIIENCDFEVLQEDEIVNNCYIYASMGKMIVRNTKITGPSDSEMTAFGINGDYLEVYDITTNLNLQHVISGTRHPRFYLNPEHLDLSKFDNPTLDRLYCTILPNNIVYECSHKNNISYTIVCDKVKVSNSAIERVYAAMGQPIYIFNGGNCAIMNNQRIKLKAGVNYNEIQWTFIAVMTDPDDPNVVFELYSDYSPQNP